MADVVAKMAKNLVFFFHWPFLLLFLKNVVPIMEIMANLRNVNKSAKFCLSLFEELVRVVSLFMMSNKSVTW